MAAMITPPIQSPVTIETSAAARRMSESGSVNRRNTARRAPSVRAAASTLAP